MIIENMEISVTFSLVSMGKIEKVQQKRRPFDVTDIVKKPLRERLSNLMSSKCTFTCSVTESTSYISGNILPLSHRAQPTVISNHLDVYSAEQER